MINKITNDDIKNKCLVPLLSPEQKPNKDPLMIVILPPQIAQNAMLL
jgi:hypothetical protein